MHTDMYNAAPTCPPQDVEIRPLNATALIITWGPPPSYAVNGILTAYTVLFTMVETGGREKVERDGQHTALVVSSLHPDYHYSVTISSNTTAGEGPFSDLVGTRLPQDGINELLGKNEAMKSKNKQLLQLLVLTNSLFPFKTFPT